MDLPIIDKLQEQTRKAETRTREQIRDLQNRGRDLIDRGGDHIKDHATRSRRTLGRAEIQALDTVGTWLEAAHQATGERADWLDKGRSFLAQVARDIQLGNLTVDDLPIPDYDALSVKKIAAELPGLEPAQWDLVRSYELSHKNRVSVYRALDRLAQRDDLH
jgi:hypothetical protein